jgi:Bacterial PH domain
MKTVEHLNARLKQIGYVPQYGTIALDDLVKSLREKESVLYLLEGSIHNTLGFLIATDLKVFYVGVDKHKSPVLAHIKYEDIVSIGLIKTELPSVEIRISKKNQENFEIKGCDSKDAAKFVKLIKYFCEGIENMKK